MIRLNLQKNSFKESVAESIPSQTSINLEAHTSATMGSMAIRSMQRKWIFGTVAACLAILSGAGWFVYMQNQQAALDEAAVLPPPTEVPAETPAVPEPTPAPEAPVATANAESLANVQAEKAAALQRQEDSLQKVRESQIRKDVAATKPAPAAPAPTPEPVAPEPTPVASQGPAVVAPALAGGVLDLILGQAQSSGASSKPAPTRFEDLTASERLGYQRFAFERILSIIRQITPGNGLSYSRIRIVSPGIVAISGKCESEQILGQLLQGFSAQSLVDAKSTFSNGLFTVTARLPFSSSAGATGGLSANVDQLLQSTLDQAGAQGVTFKKPASSAKLVVGGLERRTWKLSGLGSWEGVDRWIASLVSTSTPMGFTELSLSPGTEGKLRVEVSAIAYTK